MIAEFLKFLDTHELDFHVEQAIAIAVSGGPDSMALAHCVLDWAARAQKGPYVNILTVNHGLREEATAEAEFVAQSFAKRDGCCVQILRWEHDGVKTRVLEEARYARYELMAGYCQEHGINYLLTAHHKDDQAETVLIRLAAGSGIDGLSGMASLQPCQGTLLLVRPLLSVTKAELLGYCHDHQIKFISDPSNESEAYTRVRLRRAREVLEEEGLSAARLCALADRAGKAREALEFYADKAFEDSMSILNTKQIVLNFSSLNKHPFEIVLRCLYKGMNLLEPFDLYKPRREKIERLCAELLSEGRFRRQTLGGIIFDRDDHAEKLILEREHSAR